MRITFPHMGNLYIALEGIFNYLDVEVVLPPLINKETINLGTQNTPEAACLPFKIILGNFIQALNQGADTVVMLGGNGPCRFGYFGTLAEGILKDKGYQFDMILLEGSNLLPGVNLLKRQSGTTYWQIIKAIRLGWAKLVLIDELEKLTLKIRPRESRPGAVSAIFDEALLLVRQAKNNEELIKIKNKVLSEFDKQKTGRPVLRVGIVGDIYMMIEPSVNHRMEVLLGNLGVEVCRSIFISDWLLHSVNPHKKHLYKKSMLEAGYPYLKDFIGGHGLDSVANTVLYAQKGYDGVIQIMPMTCMPEIVALSILPEVHNQHGIPMLNMVLDEHSGEVGFATRIEAFIDLLEKRKEKITV